MLNDSLFYLSFTEVKDFVLNDLTIFNIAISYVLIYVVYKSMGRYLYFKPEEHASKINRTFLIVALIIVILSSFKTITDNMPIIAQYRWIFSLSLAVLGLAFLSMLMKIIFYKTNDSGYLQLRNEGWIPIPNDYFKAIKEKTEEIDHEEMHASIIITERKFEQEVVVSTQNNIHSDALINLLAIIVFNVIIFDWALKSSFEYGYYAHFFYVICTLFISLIYLERSVFSWLSFLEEKLFETKFLGIRIAPKEIQKFETSTRTKFKHF